MTRTAILVIAMSAAGLMTLHVMHRFSEPTQRDTFDVTEFDEATTEYMMHYEQFKAALKSSLSDLTQRKANLAEATERVYFSARAHSPIYLERICVSEIGKTHEERIARNLIGHLRDLQEVNPHIGERVIELDIELETWLCEQERVAKVH